MFMNAQVRLTSSLGPSTLSNVSKCIILLELPLLAAPYSMTPSALADGLWSLICSLYIYIYIQEKGKGYLLMIPRAAIIKCQNTWHKPVGLVSKQGRCFVSRAYFFLYISHLLPHFSYFIIADLKRESTSLWKLCFYHLADLVDFVAIILLRPSFFKEPSTNSVSHFLLSCHLLFSFF